jgi:hypothetical protein
VSKEELYQIGKAATGGFKESLPGRTGGDARPYARSYGCGSIHVLAHLDLSSATGNTSRSPAIRI